MPSAVRDFSNWIVERVEWIFLISVAMILLGGLGYVPFTGGNFIRAYQIHYDIIFFINDPFSFGFSAIGQIYGAVDAVICFLVIPSLFGLLISQAHERTKAARSRRRRLRRFAYKVIMQSVPPGTDEHVIREKSEDYYEYLLGLGYDVSSGKLDPSQVPGPRT